MRQGLHNYRKRAGMTENCPVDQCEKRLLTYEIERLRKALELLADELPEEMHTLDEPDEAWEVIVKMRTIAREAIFR